MRYRITEHFERSFANAPKKIQKAFDKQIRLLLENIRYPSLRAKKYDETTGLWQARVTRNIRFYFLIQKDTYLLIDIEKHRD